MPSTPCSTQSCASSRVSIPFNTTFIVVVSLTRLTKSQVSDGDVRPTPVMSMPLNIGLGGEPPLLPVWQLAQSRVSSRRKRDCVSVFRPAGVSTVIATTGHPAACARFSMCSVASHLFVV